MIATGSTATRRLDRSARAWLPAAVPTAAAAMYSLAPARAATMGEKTSRHRRRTWLPAILLCAITATSVCAADDEPEDPHLQAIIREALKLNPEIAAASREKDAASHRAASAGALDDPMIEAGLLNVPTNSLRLNQEDMTMKMLGISQRLPYPGKRGLRESLAAKDVEVVDHGYRETVNRVVRDIRVAYYDLALIDQTYQFHESNRQLLTRLLQITESRYAVGQGAQADTLKVQTQISKMDEDFLRVLRDRQSLVAELERLYGRAGQEFMVKLPMPRLRATDFSVSELRDAAFRDRPQLLGLKTLIDRNQKALELAREDYHPDFDLRFQYGQRDKIPDGAPRSDLISMTLAFNLPLWGKQKLEPKIAEAQAKREQAMSLYQAQQNELLAKLRVQVAIAEQTRASARLYQTALLPQARLTVESALAAFRVNKVDFAMLLDSQMAVFNYELDHAGLVIAFNKALAEIDLLTGKSVVGAQ